MVRNGSSFFFYLTVFIGESERAPEQNDILAIRTGKM